MFEHRFPIGDYYYIPEKLIFVRKDALSFLDQGILDRYPDDPSGHLVTDLNRIDADDLKIGRGPISKCTILLTNTCALRCRYCSESSMPTNAQKDLSEEEVRAFIEEVVDLRLHSDKDIPLRFTITGGGEPTIRWDLFTSTVWAIESTCGSNGLPYEIMLSTNGYLDDEKRRFILEHCDGVMVSYDGMPEINAVNRPLASGKDPTAVVEETIEFFIRNGKDPEIRSTLYFDQMTRLEQISDYLDGRFGKVRWSMNIVMPTGRGQDAVHREIDPDSVVDGYLKVFRKRLSKHGIETNCSLFPRKITPMPCGAILPLCSSLTLKPDGEIVTCPEVITQTVLGRVEGERIVYNTSCSDHLLKHTQRMIVQCRDCIAYRFCKGGCPGHHEMYSVLGVENYECVLAQRYWEKVLQSMSEGEPHLEMRMCQSEHSPDILEMRIDSPESG